MDKEKKTEKPANTHEAPEKPSAGPGPVSSQQTVNQLAKEFGISEVKLAGIMAYAGWDENTRLTRSAFKKVADEWLGHPLGTGKKRKEVK
jgi:hemolysin activation/secretion protein